MNSNAKELHDAPRSIYLGQMHLKKNKKGIESVALTMS